MKLPLVDFRIVRFHYVVWWDEFVLWDSSISVKILSHKVFPKIYDITAIIRLQRNTLHNIQCKVLNYQFAVSDLMLVTNEGTKAASKKVRPHWTGPATVLLKRTWSQHVRCENTIRSCATST